MNKSEILRLLLEHVSADLQTMSAAQRAVVDGATHEENKPENDKDTRALEQSYLARGQAQRVVELQSALNQLKALELSDFSGNRPAALGALVAVEGMHDTAYYFLAPAGGGLRLRLPEAEVRVVTPQSPVGRALIGKRPGDDVDLRTPQGVSECTIATII